MESNNEAASLMTRLRTHRLASTFTLLTVLTGGVLAGSALTRDVGAREQNQINTSDARPLIIPNPVTLSNGFSAIVKQVGPAVVNINVETLPKKAAQAPRRRGAIPNPHGGDPQNQGDMQDFFNRFFGGQEGMATTIAQAANGRPWVRALSWTRAATSSPTTMSSTRRTRSMCGWRTIRMTARASPAGRQP